MRGATVILGIALLAQACTSGQADATDTNPDASLTPDLGDAAGPACTAAADASTGKATYYDADGTGSCSFDAGTTDGNLVAALNDEDWNHAGLCGACAAVTGPMGTVTVRIVDKCPGCASGDLDLSREAFAKVAQLSAGRVPINWHVTECPVAGPIEFQFKAGSSKFYTAIQVRNHRYPIAKLEVQQVDGSWTSIARVDYNYFVASSGLGSGPYTLRTTDTRGHQLVDAGVALGADAVREGAEQFPVCPAE